MTCNYNYIIFAFYYVYEQQETQLLSILISVMQKNKYQTLHNPFKLHGAK